MGFGLLIQYSQPLKETEVLDCGGSVEGQEPPGKKLRGTGRGKERTRINDSGCQSLHHQEEFAPDLLRRGILWVGFVTPFFVSWIDIVSWR